jgi:hypothetical protein
VAVEFYSSSVLKELNGEQETGRCRLDGGNEEGGALVRFGYLCSEESCRLLRIVRWCGSADGSRRWETMPWWAILGQKVERSGPVSVGVKERRKWVTR